MNIKKAPPSAPPSLNDRHHIYPDYWAEVA